MRPQEGVCGGAKIFGSAYYNQREVFASLWALFFILIVFDTAFGVTGEQ